uniref:CMP-N-acetylneuraminate-beta-galactosamide-alpha-2,3-sialyltransferase 2 n=2 Tax=Sphaerodactylus townsendi TaxID=933632 RepID=A0ACB8F6F6_9SAUR
MNKAPTAGFEEDVGAKTTHHFMYPESAINLNPGVHLVLVPFKPLDLEWLTSALSSGDIQYTYERVKQFIKADKDKILIVNPTFLKYIHDKWTKKHGKYPSTGLIALIFAIHTCTQVSVFGFGADSNGNWHHFWEENDNPGGFHKTGVHDAVFEQRLIERLATEGKVAFYK